VRVLLPCLLLMGLAISSAALSCGTGTKEKFSDVPLASVFVTWPQKGLQYADYGDESGVDQELVRKFLELRPRASNLFLVKVKNRREAIEAGLSFLGGRDLTLPTKEDKYETWLVAFLGFSSSSPPRWNVEKVSASQTTIRIDVILDSRPLQRTRDLFPYFAFIPIKGLKPGTYHLDLRESPGMESMMTRKVRLLEERD
jgi:hypothetical protein